MRKLDVYVEQFILPNILQLDPYLHRKAKVLAYINLFLTLLALFFVVATLTIMPENKDVPTVQGVFLGLFLLVIFKKKGSLILSGNLLAAAYTWVVAPSVFVTGGLFSDNLLWLIVTPLIALLFADKRSGLVWLVGLIVFTVYLYNTNENIGNTIFFNSKVYYLLSYTFLFLAIFCTVMIFENGQWLIIKMLNEQKAVLELQKLEIAKKNQALEAVEELKLTNLELENFAFAASHDLKEPLRMIGMYTQLTKKRLKGQMDSSSIEFMGYVTDGVSRMQILLDDLLLYSRLGKKEEDVKDVDLNNVLFVVIHNLMATMKETEASIMANPLPTIKGSSTEMIQLFQNLIANSIKFRKKEVTPEIKILLEDTGDAYQLCFEDNGIGIKKEYHEKVFNIFERLHTRNDYEGSGIGLATVKKIVHNAGGRIWLASTEGVGTSFYFTIPKVT
jgi:signal transduction histidine kinase